MAATATASNIGFDFSNYARNQFLGARTGGLPKGEFEVASVLTSSYLDWYHHRRIEVWWRR